MFTRAELDDEEQGLDIEFDQGSTFLSLAWLRDHCQCSECLHPETKQRLFDTFSMPARLVTSSISIVNDEELIIVWAHENHTSVYSATFLKNLSHNPEKLTINHALWKGRIFNDIGCPSIEYDAVMNSEEGVKDLLELTEMYGFCFVQNTPPNEHGTTSVANRVAYTRHTIFGGYYEMVANLEHKDTAYTPLKIEPHTDGTYSNDAPSYQVLHCLEERCEGGENVLVDGFKIAEVMRQEHSDDFNMLTRVPVPAQYIDTTRDIHLMARRPILRLDEDDNVVQVSFNNHDRAPFLPNWWEVGPFYRALNTFAKLYSNPEYHFRQKLYPGACLFFDNWRVLHARDAYTGYRKLAGVYFNKEDVESRLRVLRSKFNK